MKRLIVGGYLVLIFVGAVGPGPVQAGKVPNVIDYQGRLVDGGGRPVNGVYDITFRVYDETQTPLWKESRQVQVTDGLYHLMLGAKTNFGPNVFSGPERWLGIEVGNGGEMTPRARIGSVPYALRSGNPDQDGDWTVTGDDMHATPGGNVGIGVTGPQTKLDVGVAPEETTDLFRLHDAGDTLVIVEHDGDVGIDTADPEARLDVGVPYAIKGRTMFRVHMAGDAKFLVDGQGQVGVGTAEPGGALEVNYPGGASSPGLLVRSGDLTTIDLETAVGETWRLQSGDNGEFTIWKLVGENALTISHDLKAGFGTRTPDAKLHVEEDSGSGVHPFQVDVSGNPRLIVQNNGRVGIGTDAPDNLLDVRGVAQVQVLRITGGADLSEGFRIREQDGDAREIPPGTVVSIDPDRVGGLVVSQAAYDRRVAGVVSGAGGVSPGVLMGQQETAADGGYPVALSGRVYCRCVDDNGPIHPGDLLTPSGKAGCAMRVTDHAAAAGAVLGKAMSSLESGEGLVLVLVSLQ